MTSDIEKAKHNKSWIIWVWPRDIWIIPQLGAWVIPRKRQNIKLMLPRKSWAFWLLVLPSPNSEAWAMSNWGLLGWVSWHRDIFTPFSFQGKNKKKGGRNPCLNGLCLLCVYCVYFWDGTWGNSPPWYLDTSWEAAQHRCLSLPRKRQLSTQ